MALILPKLVALTNVKLSVLYYVLLFSFGLVLALRFLNLTENSVIAVPNGQVTAWVGGHHGSVNSTLLHGLENLTLDLCNNPGIYEYWWDSHGEWRQGPHKCLTFCTPNVTGAHNMSGGQPNASNLQLNISGLQPNVSGAQSSNSSIQSNASGALNVSGVVNSSGANRRTVSCVRPAETYIREASDSVFFVTEFGERYVDTETSARHYFVPSADTLKLGFEYSFSIFDNGPFNSRTDSGTDRLFSSSKDILTVVATSTGNDEYKVSSIIRPPNKVFLSVSQLLQLADRPLDVIQPQSGSNRRPGAMYPSGPLARMAGVELRVHITCYESLDHTSLDLEDDWEGPVCIAEVRSVPTWWTSKHQVEVVERDGSLRERQYHGVRVGFTVGGTYRFFNFNKLLLNFASCLVYLSLPGKFMLFFCIYCLGHLSSMYKQAVYQRCDLREQCAGTVARLLSVGTSFSELQGRSEPETGDETVTPAISRGKLKRRLRSIARNQGETLNEQDMEDLVEFCFRTLAGIYGTRARADIVRLCNPQGSEKPITAVVHDMKTQRGEVITVNDFSAANASTEQFSFSSFRELLDANRTPTRLEKLFMPHQMRAQREAARYHFTDASKDSSRESSPDRGLRDPREIQRDAAKRDPRFPSPPRRGGADFDFGDASEEPSQSVSARLRDGFQRIGTRLGGVASSSTGFEGGVEPKLHSSPMHGDEEECASKSSAEPSPEPAAVTIGASRLDCESRSCQAVAQRVSSLEDSLRSCEERLAGVLKNITTRMAKLESGLAAHTKEFGSTKKKIDMLEALTDASASIPLQGMPAPPSTYGGTGGRQAMPTPSRDIRDQFRTILSPRPVSVSPRPGPPSVPVSADPTVQVFVMPPTESIDVEPNSSSKPAGRVKRLTRSTRSTKYKDNEPLDKLRSHAPEAVMVSGGVNMEVDPFDSEGFSDSAGPPQPSKQRAPWKSRVNPVQEDMQGDEIYLPSPPFASAPGHAAPGHRSVAASSSRPGSSVHQPKDGVSASGHISALPPSSSLRQGSSVYNSKERHKSTVKSRHQDDMQPRDSTTSIPECF